jgi:ABC-type sulfate transport system permease component
VEFPLVWRRALAAAALAFARVLAECFAIVLIAHRISR